MFNWNPFAKPKEEAAPVEQRPPATSFLPEEVAMNEAMLREFAAAKADILPRGFILDILPMQRAVLNGTFILPLLEPPVETADGSQVKLKVMTFYNDTTLCVFSSAAHMREFLNRHIQADGVAVRFVDGQQVCAMGAQMGFSDVAINPEAEHTFVMPRLVFETLSSGRVLMGMNEGIQDYHDVEVGSVPGGLPHPETVAEMKRVLDSFGAKRAIWHAQTVLDRQPPEVFVSLATEGVGEEQMPQMTRALTEAWTMHWPFNTPLRLVRLDDSADVSIYEKYGEPLYP